jgi:signal peptidase I
VEPSSSPISPIGAPIPDVDLEPGPPGAPSPNGGAPAAPGDRGSHRTARIAAEWIGLILLALLIAILIKAFLFQAFYIPSESMTPTLKVNDRVLVNKLSYRLHPVHRGDIIVFKAPPHTDPGINDLVKRVIGLPGETVSARRGHIYIDGRQLREPYLPAGTITSDFAPVTLANNSYWVMGDNRGNSKDSRVFGAIPKDHIVGRVFLRIWPPKRFGFM